MVRLFITGTFWKIHQLFRGKCHKILWIPYLKILNLLCLPILDYLLHHDVYPLLFKFWHWKTHLKPNFQFSMNSDLSCTPSKTLLKLCGDGIHPFLNKISFVCLTDYVDDLGEPVIDSSCRALERQQDIFSKRVSISVKLLLSPYHFWMEGQGQYGNAQDCLKGFRRGWLYRAIVLASMGWDIFSGMRTVFQLCPEWHCQWQKWHLILSNRLEKSYKELEKDKINAYLCGSQCQRIFIFTPPICGTRPEVKQWVHFVVLESSRDKSQMHSSGLGDCCQYWVITCLQDIGHIWAHSKARNFSLD